VFFFNLLVMLSELLTIIGCVWTLAGVCVMFSELLLYCILNIGCVNEFDLYRRASPVPGVVVDVGRVDKFMQDRWSVSFVLGTPKFVRTPDLPSYLSIVLLGDVYNILIVGIFKYRSSLTWQARSNCIATNTISRRLIYSVCKYM